MTEAALASTEAWPAWFSTWREGQAALASWPNRRQENWKYTDLRRFESLGPVATGADAVQPEDLVELGLPAGPRLVFIDGVFRDELSALDGLGDGVTVRSLAAAGAAELEPLRTALASRGDAPDLGLAARAGGTALDGPVIAVASGAVIDTPLQLVFIALQHDRPGTVDLHGLVHVGAGARVGIVEHQLSLGDPESFSNLLVDVQVDAGAAIDYYRIQQVGARAGLVTRLAVVQAADSAFTYRGFDFGGGTVRHDVDVRLVGEGARTALNGIYALAETRHVDNHTRVDHIAPQTASDEFFKGVLDGRSRGVFNGKVVVHEGAVKIEANQSNRNLLLSREAEIDTKPELEIYADDVQCSHGATVGQLDETQLFYLRSRGIGEEAARQMLIDAFCQEIVDQLADEALRTYVGGLLDQALPHTNEKATA
ncbi:MAG: Fe-S cluster assembly protein SufD [Pseudomonadota bacterium]